MDQWVEMGAAYLGLVGGLVSANIYFWISELHELHVVSMEDLSENLGESYFFRIKYSMFLTSSVITTFLRDIISEKNVSQNKTQITRNGIRMSW